MAQEASSIDRDPTVTAAINAAGGVAKLASLISVSSQAISQWTRVPAERVLQIERATGGKITRHELRPDLYPLGDERDAPTRATAEPREVAP